MLNGRAVRVALMGVSFAVVASCGGGVIPKTGGTAQGAVSGVVFKGPVANGTVRAVRLSSALERGDELVSGTTNEAGEFELKLPPYSGPLLIVASSGTYTEEAIGLGVKLDGNELTALIPNYTGGAVVTGLRLTPVSSLATAFALHHARAGKPLVDAHEEARLHLHQHFGALDWGAVSPADLSSPGVTNLSPEARAGLLISGLSWLAKQQAEASDVTPGLVINAATLTTLLVRDASDGTLDGKAGADVLKSAKVELTGLTLRSELVQGMTGFINGSRNASQLRLQDVTAFLAIVGTNNDPYLFCPGGVAAPTCGSGPIDTEPPVIAFVRPMPGAGVAGSTTVEVRASDNTKIRSLRFTAPQSLVNATPVFTNEQREGSLTAVLDVSALPDGALELRAEVVDDAGNPAAKTLSVTVSNQGPRLSINAPGDGATVRGTSVLVSASATAQAPGATIARIELVNPPPGVGADTLPAADSFAATWDTTMALEGTNVISLRATDSFGTQTEATVTVLVDNVPLGQVTAVVTAGAPVDGLTVKLVAVDPASGLPVVGRMGGPILGQATSATVDGGVTFELTQENYVGPVQLVAEGPSASYLDPSDGQSEISLPATFTLSSYVSSYSTGTRLERPITYWTTLADAAARSYALGRNPNSPTPVSLPTALATVDPLFSRHITTAPWDSRTVFPARLTTTSQALRDVVYAAAPDIALNQEARDIAEEVGLTPGTGFGAPQLISLLLQDLGDGFFDGRANGVQLQTAGTQPYLLDANTTRFREAIALDRFIRGAQNRTQLTRQDLQTSGIYDRISSDTSILYPAAQPPIPFDNVAPSVTWTLTFQKSPTLTVPPVGASKLVRSLVFVSIDATDSSSVASLSLSVGGVPVIPAQGSTASHFSGTVDVSALPDGALVLVADSCDRLQNCGTSTTTVTVDNTVPSITVLRPQPAFVSAAFDIEATATDAQGLESLDATAPSGLVDQDAQVSRFFVPVTAWTLSASDGAFSTGFRACDIVGNCGAAAATVTVDKTPPTVAWVTQPPQYTKVRNVTFAVSATDGAGAGVAHVFAGVDYLNAVEGVRSGSTWTFSGLDLGAQGRRNIRVWAEDSATPTNSGRMSTAAGADLLFVSTWDSGSPSLVPASYRAFKDEDGITLNVDGSGRPLVPASINFGSAPNRTVDLSASSFTIKKADPLTSAPTNRPMLTWQVPVNTSTESPIASVTWSATRASCRPDTGACSTLPFGSGALALDGAVPSPAPNSVYYSMELTMPLKGTYAFTFTATDAAGNSASRGFTLVWDVVGPPLVVVPDSSWESSGDPQSALPLRLADGSFGRLFGIGLGGFLDSQARVRRFLVYNPFAMEVPVYFEPASSNNARTTNESWNNILGNLFGAAGPGQFSLDGHTFDRDYWSTFTSASDYCSDAGRLIEPYPCAITASSFPYIRHVRGQVTRWECFNNLRTEGPSYGPTLINNTNTSLNGATDSTVTTQYVSPAAAPGSGNETSKAAPVYFSSGSGARVPAAVGATAGVAAVYVVVPLAPHSVTLSTLPLPYLPAAAGKYQYYYADMVDMSQANTPVPAPLACNGVAQSRFAMYYWYRRLNSASTSVAFDVRYITGGNLFLGGFLNNSYFSAASNRQVGGLSNTVSIVH